MKTKKWRLSGEYISQKPPEIVGVGSSSPPGKEKYLFVCTPQLGHEKTPKPLGYRGFPVQYFFVAQHVLSAQKRYFQFLHFPACFFIKSSGFSLISDIFKDRTKKIFANTSKAVFAGWMYSQSKRSP
ncbi:MAG: hypothetical protein II896_05655, partial [Clostridia bacterium]|nr:hypothetical protein [Clostridia bacterium]